MPFAGKQAFSFTAVSIGRNAPKQSGVYGLSNANRWLVVGEADDLQATLRAVFANPGSPLLGARATGFTFELCDGFTRSSRLARLVTELSPSCT